MNSKCLPLITGLGNQKNEIANTSNRNELPPKNGWEKVLGHPGGVQSSCSFASKGQGALRTCPTGGGPRGRPRPAWGRLILPSERAGGGGWGELGLGGSASTCSQTRGRKWVESFNPFLYFYLTVRLQFSPYICPWNELQHINEDELSWFWAAGEMIPAVAVAFRLDESRADPAVCWLEE